MQTVTAQQLQKKYRIQSIDLLRGLVMIIMALDHVRDFFHYDVNIGQDPLDFSTTTPILFLTRWITHFCAPVFVFLSGTGIFLYSIKNRTKQQVAFFLLTRGLWLMLAEIIIINPAWSFNIYFSETVLQVIWAIGISMVCLSALQFLPYKVLLVLGLIIVFSHNLFDGISVKDPSFIWSLLHQPHNFHVAPHVDMLVMYPFMSWLGLMICGYCLGKLYMQNVDTGYRKRFLFYTGLLLIVLFILIRFLNIYGDLHKWTVQKTTVFTILDFINTTKYPPSLLYMLMTIGPALVFLSFAEKTSNWLSNKITVFGKVPFFYYFMHILLIHLVRWVFFFAAGHNINELTFPNTHEGNMPLGVGYPLWEVYLIWIGIVVLLYFPCKWYSRYKATHQYWWLSYV
ncbi:MAG TPA: heparan-alpha-glucosaminide N-acetyltransferase domain-containing protein [Chitinophagaceae bacterium]|nr:heparan-alpha-glucosaminide N-acetyltransferase domain-containing protein [Chitinophagaceae bacterium]